MPHSVSQEVWAEVPSKEQGVAVPTGWKRPDLCRRRPGLVSVLPPDLCQPALPSAPPYPRLFGTQTSSARLASGGFSNMPSSRRRCPGTLYSADVSHAAPPGFPCALFLLLDSPRSACCLLLPAVLGPRALRGSSVLVVQGPRRGPNAWLSLQLLLMPPPPSGKWGPG